MASGGKRNENDFFDCLKKLQSDDNVCGVRSTGLGTTSEDQLRKWDQEGKMYVRGKQFISPQRIQIIRESLENQGSPLVTAAPSANAIVHHHTNLPIRKDQMGFPQAEGTSIISDEDPYMSVVCPAQKVTEFPMKSQKTTSSCLIDKVPLSKQDSGLADMDNSSPVEATSDSMDN